MQPAKSKSMLISGHSLNPTGNNFNQKLLPSEFQHIKDSRKEMYSVYPHPKEKYKKVVVLNKQYEIDQDHELYDSIQILTMMLQQKEAITNKKYKIKQTFQLHCYSSLEFILSKSNMKEQNCTICMDQFEIKNLEKQLAQQSAEQDIYMLRCNHKYHLACLQNLIGDKKWAKCPICSTIFGRMVGDQPEGTMDVTYDKHTTLSGYEKGTIIINYDMKGCTRNGVTYSGTRRRAYLPDCKQGRDVLYLFQEAFDRKLIFTVGDSVTSGLKNQTVWNGIHHKTMTSGGAANYGYPDKTYLSRVKEELAAKGITLDSISSKKEADLIAFYCAQEKPNAKKGNSLHTIFKKNKRI